jgi:hypothetical protein
MLSVWLPRGPLRTGQIVDQRQTRLRRRAACGGGRDIGLRSRLVSARPCWSAAVFDAAFGPAKQIAPPVSRRAHKHAITRSSTACGQRRQRCRRHVEALRSQCDRSFGPSELGIGCEASEPPRSSGVGMALDRSSGFGSSDMCLAFPPCRALPAVVEKGRLYMRRALGSAIAR